MRIGFTGTRDFGREHFASTSKWLHSVTRDANEFTSGAARGFDYYVAEWVSCVYPDAINRVIVPGPPLEYEGRALNSATATVWMDPAEDRGASAGARNEVILDHSDVLIAVASGPEKMRGSGTWWTIRKARKRGIATIVYRLDKGMSEVELNG